MRNKKTRAITIAIATFEAVFLVIVAFGHLYKNDLYSFGMITAIKWISGVLACVLFVILVNCENGKYKTNAVLMFVVNAALLISA